ncbi:MAG: YIP1 family protein [Candidatus Aminicenantes bacterium]|nr:YIP1 family protein [Candidatus Aminicenantes bacterium]
MAIIVKPREEWCIIKEELTTIEDLFARYAVILAAVPAAAGFIGYSIFGRPGLIGYVSISLKENLKWTILSYILSLASVFLLAYIIDMLAPFFGAKRDLPAAVKIVVYSQTASWAAGLLLVFPQLALLVVGASLYSLYLLYTGMKSVKEVPPDRLTGYFAAAIFASIVISMGILLVAGFILGSAA